MAWMRMAVVVQTVEAEDGGGCTDSGGFLSLTALMRLDHLELASTMTHLGSCAG
jgi:hypothetical protein